MAMADPRTNEGGWGRWGVEGVGWGGVGGGVFGAKRILPMAASRTALNGQVRQRAVHVGEALHGRHVLRGGQDQPCGFQVLPCNLLVVHIDLVVVVLLIFIVSLLGRGRGGLARCPIATSGTRHLRRRLRRRRLGCVVACVVTRVARVVVVVGFVCRPALAVGRGRGIKELCRVGDVQGESAAVVVVQIGALWGQLPVALDPDASGGWQSGSRAGR